MQDLLLPKKKKALLSSRSARPTSSRHPPVTPLHQSPKSRRQSSNSKIKQIQDILEQQIKHKQRQPRQKPTRSLEPLVVGRGISIEVRDTPEGGDHPLKPVYSEQKGRAYTPTARFPGR